MIPRYTPAAFAELWSTSSRYAAWLEVELAACEAMEKHGKVPEGVAARLRAKSLQLDAERIETIERTTKHDVIAFLSHVEELAGDDARFLHRGMTSSDVLDTSFAVLLARAGELLLARMDRYVDALAKRADEHRATVMMGRSHGMFAEPTTFGFVLAGHLTEAKRARRRLADAKREIAVGKIAGAVGTYAHLSPEIEALALSKLGLRPETVATQIVARDRHAAFFTALALAGTAIERLATNVRHWQRTEVGEAEERFDPGQKGSSAMPHKRNPIASENLCGQARLLRGYAVPALEDVALWHERDISHSSVERTIGPDATTTLGYMLERAATLVEGLVVYPDVMRANVERSGELWGSEALLLALVDAGLPRQKGYELVQRCAMAALSSAREKLGAPSSFRAIVLADTGIGQHLDPDAIARAFDLQHATRHVSVVIDRALGEP